MKTATVGPPDDAARADSAEGETSTNAKMAMALLDPIRQVCTLGRNGVRHGTLPREWHAWPVSRVTHLNRSQRIILVIALAGVLYFVGSYVKSLGERFDWVGYAPLSSQGYAPLASGSFSGLHPWARLVVWLGLTVVWGSAPWPCSGLARRPNRWLAWLGKPACYWLLASL